MTGFGPIAQGPIASLPFSGPSTETGTITTALAGVSNAGKASAHSGHIVTTLVGISQALAGGPINLGMISTGLRGVSQSGLFTSRGTIQTFLSGIALSGAIGSGGLKTGTIATALGGAALGGSIYAPVQGIKTALGFYSRVVDRFGDEIIFNYSAIGMSAGASVIGNETGTIATHLLGITQAARRPITATGTITTALQGISQLAAVFDLGVPGSGIHSFYTFGG